MDSVASVSVVSILQKLQALQAMLGNLTAHDIAEMPRTQTLAQIHHIHKQHISNNYKA